MVGPYKDSRYDFDRGRGRGRGNNRDFGCRGRQQDFNRQRSFSRYFDEREEHHRYGGHHRHPSLQRLSHDPNQFYPSNRENRLSDWEMELSSPSPRRGRDEDQSFSRRFDDHFQDVNRGGVPREVLEYFQKFRTHESYLRLRLRKIEEAGKQGELEEEVQDIEHILDVFSDINADQSLGIPIIKGACDKILDIVRKNPLKDANGASDDEEEFPPFVPSEDRPSDSFFDFEENPPRNQPSEPDASSLLVTDWNYRPERLSTSAPAVPAPPAASYVREEYDNRTLHQFQVEEFYPSPRGPGAERDVEIGVPAPLNPNSYSSVNPNGSPVQPPSQQAQPKSNPRNIMRTQPREPRIPPDGPIQIVATHLPDTAPRDPRKRQESSSSSSGLESICSRMTIPVIEPVFDQEQGGVRDYGHGLPSKTVPPTIIPPLGSKSGPPGFERFDNQPQEIQSSLLRERYFGEDNGSHRQVRGHPQIGSNFSHPTMRQDFGQHGQYHPQMRPDFDYQPQPCYHIDPYERPHLPSSEYNYNENEGYQPFRHPSQTQVFSGKGGPRRPPMRPQRQFPPRNFQGQTVRPFPHPRNPNLRPPIRPRVSASLGRAPPEELPVSRNSLENFNPPRKESDQGETLNSIRQKNFTIPGNPRQRLPQQSQRVHGPAKDPGPRFSTPMPVRPPNPVPPVSRSSLIYKDQGSLLASNQIPANPRVAPKRPPQSTVSVTSTAGSTKSHLDIVKDKVKSRIVPKKTSKFIEVEDTFQDLPNVGKGRGKRMRSDSGETPPSQRSPSPKKNARRPNNTKTPATKEAPEIVQEQEEDHVQRDITAKNTSKTHFSKAKATKNRAKPTSVDITKSKKSGSGSVATASHRGLVGKNTNQTKRNQDRGMSQESLKKRRRITVQSSSEEEESPESIVESVLSSYRLGRHRPTSVSKKSLRPRKPLNRPAPPESDTSSIISGSSAATISTTTSSKKTASNKTKAKAKTKEKSNSKSKHKKKKHKKKKPQDAELAPQAVKNLWMNPPSGVMEMPSPSKNIIGRNDIVVNPSLCKVKMEIDYIPPVQVKVERVEMDNRQDSGDLLQDVVGAGPTYVFSHNGETDVVEENNEEILGGVELETWNLDEAEDSSAGGNGEDLSEFLHLKVEEVDVDEMELGTSDNDIFDELGFVETDPLN